MSEVGETTEPKTEKRKVKLAKVRIIKGSLSPSRPLANPTRNSETDKGPSTSKDFNMELSDSDIDAII